MITPQQVHQFETRTSGMRRIPNANRRLDEHMLRGLNKLKKPGTAEGITELLNRDLDPGERPFSTEDVANWLRNADNVLNLYWLGNRPRRYSLPGGGLATR